ncbi:MAG: hypothetical protein R3E83_04785 [Burkholderiaceae bacterium]
MREDYVPRGCVNRKNPSFKLDPEGAGVARGYGAAALGWGLVCVLLRSSQAADVVMSVLIASLAFNGAEVLLQVPVALSGIASPMIWVTIAGHALLAVLSLAGLVTARTRRRLA